MIDSSLSGIFLSIGWLSHEILKFVGLQKVTKQCCDVAKFCDVKLDHAGCSYLIIPGHAMQKLLSPRCHFISINPKQCTKSTPINNINKQQD